MILGLFPFVRATNLAELLSNRYFDISDVDWLLNSKKKKKKNNNKMAKILKISSRIDNFAMHLKIIIKNKKKARLPFYIRVE